ncbi:MAG TPA: hypothetical protein VFA50_19890 [Stellaceae bacterium]|nr:hypothetical protein [Stellaceae bacterium]
MAFLFLVSAAKAAPPACYRPAEIEADQAIRFQTELMVTSEVCKVSSYVDFTRRNREAIIAYQHALIDHYRRIGDRHAEATLDSYMTRLANELALSDGQQPAVTLCSGASGWLAAAGALGSADFHRIAASRAADHNDSYRHCPD